MGRLTGFIAAGWIALAGAATAQDNPVVVELFTSQGCSSCPAADAILAELNHRDDVIPLALHVDYWDYIGWQDSFAKHAFTRRQKAYARTGGWKMIYTPQMVINGVEDVVGSRPMKLNDVIRKHAALPSRVALSLDREGGILTIRAEAKADLGPCNVQLVTYLPEAEVDITRGENAGRTLSYTHIARTWDVVGEWNGQGVYHNEVSVEPGVPVVVLVQDPATGYILAAARLR